MYRRRFRNTRVISLVVAVILIGLIVFVQSGSFYYVKSEYYSKLHGRIFGEENVTLWRYQTYAACGGNFEGFGHEFAVLKNVLMKENQRKFYIACNEIQHIEYSFNYGLEGTHLNKWLENVVPTLPSEFEKMTGNRLQDNANAVIANLPVQNEVLDRVVVAVQRYEAANVYHTMTDWYNIYLVSRLLNIPIDNIDILLYGSNAHAYLDGIWETLFKRILYTDEIKGYTQFPVMVWNVLGYESPMNFHGRQHLPFAEEFREFFFRKHGITTSKSLDCHHLSIVFLFRRNYVSHEGNKKGIIKRKIKNENELLETIKHTLPSASVEALQFDQLSFTKQLQVISETDILISMHGAGLTHVLFLPKHASVVELYPVYLPKTIGVNHFEAFSRWRGLKYTYWQNYNPNNEYEDYYTYVPPTALLQRVNFIYKNMCS